MVKNEPKEKHPGLISKAISIMGMIPFIIINSFLLAAIVILGSWLETYALSAYFMIALVAYIIIITAVYYTFKKFRGKQPEFVSIRKKSFVIILTLVVSIVWIALYIFVLWCILLNTIGKWV